ncbi:protein FAM177B isoform X1 [Octopus bimaculoides]|uniref:protein FAM177B isoform X1 n=1 Tax=Octopus bimaculoides TaxID=37653 RepID=UPI0022E5E895|nr:protein FAM177B isoform X1 [Octopus bimaculoides]
MMRIMMCVQTPDRDFTSIPLDGDANNVSKKKAPKRVLHFSDGILEEYSTDEEEQPEVKTQTTLDPRRVNVSTLSWLPWIWYYMVLVSAKTFNAADLCGEKLAWFFGITSPKYQYAIDEYYKEQEEKTNTEKERLHSVKTSSEPVTAPPASKNVSENPPTQDYENLDKF